MKLSSNGGGCHHARRVGLHKTNNMTAKSSVGLSVKETEESGA
jgi:hypothetical protein